jgi:hypothetical protein
MEMGRGSIVFFGTSAVRAEDDTKESRAEVFTQLLLNILGKLLKLLVSEFLHL